MNKYFRIIVATMLLTACGNFLSDSNVFESGKLKGKYKVDLTAFVAETVETEEGDDEWLKMSKKLKTRLIVFRVFLIYFCSKKISLLKIEKLLPG